jgi:hypothetical protein
VRRIVALEPELDLGAHVDRQLGWEKRKALSRHVDNLCRLT